ncbi:MAG: 50S ribosomal protein L4 [Gammaproteobacteria bacterium]|jgi:large subunit ribosomal protein L4|nr:50S ribosomal protein L4 [Gammaproteobacteria bacterium]|tara:strand:- start:7447 stop:8052 length:606 start_codon:yes stop_codon:yes gene_type:complete
MNLSLAMGGDTVEVSEVAFGREFNESLVHQVVVAYQSAKRAGTSAQKNRSEVRGGGRKPWRQKGTGRARAGTIRSPIWRGGGRTFPAKPQDYTQKVNRKMYRGAMRCIFSELIRQDRLVAVEEFSIDSPKTKNLLGKLAELSLDDVLIISSDIDDNLRLASRNLKSISVRHVSNIDPLSLISHEKVLVTLAALKECEEVLA